MWIFVAFHHHLVPISVVERDTLETPKKFSITLDARRAMTMIINKGVDFAIHGHQHQPAMVTWIEDEIKESKGHHIVSAGCLAGRDYAGESARNSFMIYEVDATSVRVHKVISSESDSEKFDWSTVVYNDSSIISRTYDENITNVIETQSFNLVNSVLN